MGAFILGDAAPWLRGAASTASRVISPRCVSLGCGHKAEWTGGMRLWTPGADRQLLAELTFPRVCSYCSVRHVRQYVAGDAFFALVADLASAGMLPAPDRDSLESEFSALP